MTNAPTHDRAAIMKEAWSYQVPGLFNARMFARDLCQAWHIAKMRAMQAVQSEADRIRGEIANLECKDTWAKADCARIDKLQAALAVANGHENNAGDYAAKCDLIEAAKGRFCAVTFTKADGSERTMQVQPAALKGNVKGAAASLSAKQAVLTRKARHPNLLPVWDAQAKAPRSVNLATISRIAVDGCVHNYTA